MSEQKRQWLFWIEEMLNNIQKIKDVTSGLTFEHYKNDFRIHDVVNLNIGNLGEFSKKIPKDIRTKYDSIPWQDMIGMRNFIFHEYPGLDEEAVWGVVEEELEPLEEALKRILKQEDK